MMRLDWLEWIGGGVEMAWMRLRQEHALHWSATALLDASVEVLVAFMVLVCTVLNFFTSSFIRVSGFHNSCSCCVHFRREASVTEVTASQDPSFLQTSKSLPYEVVLPGKDGADTDEQEEQYAKVQQLLRALQAERETMAALYSELEQERNSSATAASEALAMISRLQEEKSAIQMESWQFQRMVMEKAMYDQEVIEVLKDILAKQEDERLDLEDEVRMYKEKLDEVLMEEQENAERTGMEYMPLHTLEEEAISTSPKSERGELPSSERITPDGRITPKEDRVSPDARPVKDERITPNGRVTPTGRSSERITPSGRLEDAEFLCKLSKTNSMLLTALLQEGFPEPSTEKLMQKVIAKAPVRAESLPILEHEHYKAALLSGPIKTGREIGLPLPFPKKQIEKTLVRGATKSLPVSREPTPSPTIAFAGIVADEPTPLAGEEKVRDETVFIPPAGAKKQTEKKFTDKPLMISREVSLPILPPVATKKQVVKDERKAGGGEPEFLSLKRRWSSRGTQEISVETLAKVKEDRRMEEKRLSVLEYVRNLEEQLQQQVGRPAPQLSRARSVDGREEDARLSSSGRFESGSVSAMSSISAGALERDDSVQRRLFADGDSARQQLNVNSLQGGGDDKLHAQQYSESGHEGGFYVSSGTSEENADDALFVHDVYEVPHMRQAVDSMRRGNGKGMIHQEIAQQLREM